MRGRAHIPGDKSVGHRALIFASIAEGRSAIENLSGGLDNIATADAFRAMGVSIELDGTRASVEGVGIDGLTMAKAPIDCGNSGTTMRLLAGLLSGQPFGSRLIGDPSLTGRPMRRIIDPLRARGAHIAGTAGSVEGEFYPPINIAPQIDGEGLIALEYASPVASAQVKSCLLLSGLYARGLTAVSEPTVSRDHTERMMHALDIPLRVEGPVALLDPTEWDRRITAFDWVVPGDISSAAFLIAAALAVPGSRVSLEGVGLNPTRTGILDALRGMRANIAITPKGEAAGAEPVGDLDVQNSGLGPGLVGGELLTRMIDEVPAFCAIAAMAGGRTDVRDAEELRVKESDRLTATAGVLKAFGVDCTELADGMHVHGGARLEGAEVESLGDHRIAMLGAVLGLAAEGETIVHDVACVDTSFPGFAALLASLGADIQDEEEP